ncbi:MAG: DegV family protein [Clostridia bacterium]|nr:DegV family protein [Clostridia bacterium]
MATASPNIAIVTETLCCMDEADCRAYGVYTIPLDCCVGDFVTSDRILSAEQSVRDGEGYSIPPSEEAYCAHFEKLLSTHDGVLCITASRRFSESNRHAALAAAGFGGRVTVIDSGAVAGGLFLLVLRARHLVTLGYPMSRIKAELESYKNNLKITFTTANVQVLRRANKLVYKPAAEGESENRHPVFRIENGSIGVTDYAADDRSTVIALLSVLEDPRRSRPSPSHVVVHYANRTRAVEYLLYRLRETYPTATVYERPITLSIQLNLGHDILGVIGD